MKNLSLITPFEARENGFDPITTDICTKSEQDIILSICRTLATCQHCWIKTGPHHVQAARPITDLNLLNKEQKYFKSHNVTCGFRN